MSGRATPNLCVSQAIAAAMARGLDRLDAQLLMLHALGKKAHERAWLHAHDTDMLAPTVQAALDASVQRRAAGEPLAYITGHKEFFGLDLRVDARVLVPRPDTETLVEWALAVLPAVPNMSVLDLGTGSGAIALALKATRPELQLSAIDYSEEALAVARANAQRLQLDVQFLQGSWLDGVQARFQAIVSNPPYIAVHDQHLSALTHEPLQALASGPDGLDDIRRIVSQAPAHLHPGGWLLLEHGFDQAAAVRGLLLDAGFCDVQSRRDLSGIERCSGGQVLQD
ncbi:MAG: peptide chain release factor N(5)-glutamine methyltransferase [Rhodoferax sp.]|nr:peptide chain release factor N(5)-glutamine methyltransferase [Rhodoferax sp.]